MQNLPPQLTPQSQSPMQDMPPMGEQMMEGMENEEQQPEKIVAHFSPDEISDLNEAQGGEVFDQETGLRDYTPFDSLIKIPEIREGIIEDFSQGKQKFAMGGEVEEQGRPLDPELEKLRLEGRHGDTELAIITPYFLEFFSEVSGHPPRENPHTGLPEFRGFGRFFRSALRVVGAAFGPITGFAASKLTGQSTRAALKNAGIGAALSTLPFLGSALGGTGGFLGGSSAVGSTAGAGGAGGFLGNIGSMLGFGGGAPNAVVGANTVGRMLPASAFGQAGMQAAGQTGGGGFLGSLLGGGAGGAGGGGGFLGSLGGGIGKALPLIGSGLLVAKGHKDEQNRMREYQQALEAKEQKEKQEAEFMRERMGFNAKLDPLESYKRRQVTPNINREEYLQGAQPRYFENYSQGGEIRGDGKGQQDNIPKDIEEGGYIIDASTVSDIGDGSSDAGIKELDRYFGKIPSYGMQQEAKGGYIKAMVSDGEYEVPPEKVTAIGGGSNEKGAKILKKFVEEIRAKKRTSGKILPPKSKPISGYLKSINSNAA